ncbi:MAG: hypothetical protein WAK17_18225 [Candidatus Nitrosopolaris sp.]|jgi:hypothetical protein
MLFGKWNFVNESSSAVSNVSRDDIDNMSSTGVSGTITFGKNGDFNQTIPAKNGLGDVTVEGSWASDGHILHEFFGEYHINMTFTTVSPSHIELTDSRGDTIHLSR